MGPCGFGVQGFGATGSSWGGVSLTLPGGIPVASGSLYRQMLRAEGHGAAPLQTTHKVPSKSRSNKR